MTPSDEVRIQMSVSDIVDVAMPDMEDEAKRRAEQLVALATAAAYRHIEEYLDNSADMAAGDVQTSLRVAADFCCGWAEKAEAEKGQP